MSDNMLDDKNVLQKTRQWIESKFGKDSETMKHLEPIFAWYERYDNRDRTEGTIAIVNESSAITYEAAVNELVSQGYRVSSTNCGYAGEVGGNVYDCEYWMAVLVKSATGGRDGEK